MSCCSCSDFLIGGDLLAIIGLKAGWRGGSLQLQLRDGGVGYLFAYVARLIEIPVVYLVGLGLLHGLHDVIVLYVANAHERRQNRHRNRDQVVQIALMPFPHGLLRIFCRILFVFFGVLDCAHRVYIHRGDLLSSQAHPARY